MSERYAYVRLTKSLLLIPEKLIWKHIPAEELKKAIARGKGYKRSIRVEDYENERKEKEL